MRHIHIYVADTSALIHHDFLWRLDEIEALRSFVDVRNAGFPTARLAGLAVPAGQRQRVLFFERPNGPRHKIFGGFTVEIGDAIARVLADRALHSIVIEWMFRPIHDRADAAGWRHI